VSAKKSANQNEKPAAADCIFCGIGRNKNVLEGGNAVVFEDDVTLAFLDHRPIFPGHCLLIPRQHIETLADLPHVLVEPYFSSVQLISRAVEQAMEAEGSFVALNNRVSQSVPHLHTHVIPRRKGDGLRGFFWPRQKYKDPAEMERVAQRIRAAIANLRARQRSH